MSTAAPVSGRKRRGRLARFAIAVVILLLLLALAGSYLLQPQRASAMLLDRVGEALGLRITASGQASYRLRGTPQLVLRNVVAQRPGDATALLRTQRIFVSLPWSTIRSRGADMTIQRVELDAPVLDLPALQRWQATRPPGETRIPTLTDGMRIVDGRINNTGWRIDGIGVDLPSLAPGKPLHARVRGRYLSPPTKLPFDLDVALTEPANGAGVAAHGRITLSSDGWKMPAEVFLAGPLQLGDGVFGLAPAKIGLSARYLSSSSNVPFVLGAAGPLRYENNVWVLDPVALILRGQGVVPDAKARGAVALGRRLVLRLQGTIDGWPNAWPALPAPLPESRSPLSFALDYAGPLAFSEVASLKLRRDKTSFDARFRLTRILDWIDSGHTGSPIPPLQGHLDTPRLEIAGATLEGVEVEFEDDLPSAETAKPISAKPIRATP